jgi:hypothetical protein
MTVLPDRRATAHKMGYLKNELALSRMPLRFRNIFWSTTK